MKNCKNCKYSQYSPIEGYVCTNYETTCMKKSRSQKVENIVDKILLSILVVLLISIL